MCRTIFQLQQQNHIKNKNRKLLRWSLTLHEYDIEIEHKTGERHVNVDALSRLS